MTFFFKNAWRLSTPQEHKHSLRGAAGKVGIAGPAGARTCYPLLLQSHSDA